MPLQLFKFNFHAMGGLNEIQFFAADANVAKAISDHVILDVQTVEHKYSRYKEDSILSQINHNAGKDKCEVDQETAALLDYAEACYESSDGLFDITSGVLRKVWDFKNKKFPNESQLTEILPLVGWDKVEWQKPFFRLSLEGMEIDFGGIGKEYAVDRAAGVLLKSGIQSGLINLAGDIRVLGPQPGNKPWNIGIVHPRKPGGVIASLAVLRGAIATSGDYERFFEIDDKRYCHILNPKTGMCAEGLQSVTVLSESCLVSGSATTIAMLNGKNEGVKFLKELGAPYLYVDSLGQVFHDNSLKVEF